MPRDAYIAEMAHILAFDQELPAAARSSSITMGRSLPSAKRGVQTDLSAGRLGGNTTHSKYGKARSTRLLKQFEKPTLKRIDHRFPGNQSARTMVFGNARLERRFATLIVWQDRRTSAFCNQTRETPGDPGPRKTGLEVDAYFSASKIRWILDNIHRSRKRRGPASWLSAPWTPGSFGS
jgi:hypothetical protein